MPHRSNFYNAHRLEAAGESPITAPHIVIHMLHRFTRCRFVWPSLAAPPRMAEDEPRFVAAKNCRLWVAIRSVQGHARHFHNILSQRKVDVTTAHVAVRIDFDDGLDARAWSRVP